MKRGLFWSVAAVVVLGGLLPGTGASNEFYGMIDIQGNAAFCNGAVWSGVVNCGTADGSAERPYEISGWTFRPQSSTAIHILMTTKHVVIRNNHFEHAPLPPNTGRGGDGIYLNNADNVRIEDNTFRDLWDGVGGAGAGVIVARNHFEGNILALQTWYWNGAWEIHHNLFQDNWVAFEPEAPGSRLTLNQFRFNDVDVELSTLTGDTDLILRRNNFESTDVAHVRADSHPRVDAECNFWSLRLSNGVTVQGRRTNAETDATPQLAERDPNAGPTGQDPATRLPPTNPINAQRLQDWMACYDIVTGGPV